MMPQTGKKRTRSLVRTFGRFHNELQEDPLLDCNSCRATVAQLSTVLQNILTILFHRLGFSATKFEKTLMFKPMNGEDRTHLLGATNTYLGCVSPFHARNCGSDSLNPSSISLLWDFCQGAFGPWLLMQRTEDSIHHNLHPYLRSGHLSAHVLLHTHTDGHGPTPCLRLTDNCVEEKVPCQRGAARALGEAVV